MHYDMFPESAVDADRFVGHMQEQCGKGWSIPAEESEKGLSSGISI